MPVATMDELLNDGVHFGHLTRRWNHKMRNYIFMQRNGIQIIELKKTQNKIDEACNAIQEIARKDEQILFVGTKKQAKDIREIYA